MNTRSLLIASAATLFGLSMAGAAFAGVDRAEPREVRSVERVDVASRTERASHVEAAHVREFASISRDTAKDLSKDTSHVRDAASTSHDTAKDVSKDSAKDPAHTSSKDAAEAPEATSGR
jgi:hypothetical protein